MFLFIVLLMIMLFGPIIFVVSALYVGIFKGGKTDKQREREVQEKQLIDVWDKQAKKYDVYFDKANSKGILIRDSTRHYDGTPRYKSKDD